MYMCMLIQLCPTVCDTRDCSSPGSSVHGILLARILECVAISSSRDLFNPGIEPKSLASPALAGGFFTMSATWEAQCNRAGGLSEEVIKEGLSGRCHRRSEILKELAA